MAFSSGTFTLYSPGNPVVTGTTISSSWANGTLDGIATGLTTCVLKDGTQTITADIPMGGFSLTGLAAGAAAGESVRWEQMFGANGLIVSAGAALTAAGTNQATALQLAAVLNQVTTAASGTGVKLYATPVAGDITVIYNGGANQLTVYPQTSGTINGLAANAGFFLGTNTAVILFAATTTAWVAILSR